MIAILAVSLGATSCVTPEVRPRGEFARNDATQILHLDVDTKRDAEMIRSGVLVGWSRVSDDDVTITRMADASGREFWCVKLRSDEGDVPTT